jgi:hypothetical protein
MIRMTNWPLFTNELSRLHFKGTNTRRCGSTTVGGVFPKEETSSSQLHSVTVGRLVVKKCTDRCTIPLAGGFILTFCTISHILYPDKLQLACDNGQLTVLI